MSTTLGKMALFLSALLLAAGCCDSAHETTGCSQYGVSARGGSGRIYCFATD